MPGKNMGTGQPPEVQIKIENWREKKRRKTHFFRQIPGQPPGVQPGGSPALCWLPPVRAPAAGPGWFWSSWKYTLYHSCFSSRRFASFSGASGTKKLFSSVSCGVRVKNCLWYECLCLRLWKGEGRRELKSVDKDKTLEMIQTKKRNNTDKDKT